MLHPKYQSWPVTDLGTRFCKFGRWEEDISSFSSWKKLLTLRRTKHNLPQSMAIAMTLTSRLSFVVLLILVEPIYIKVTKDDSDKFESANGMVYVRV